jgi:two-component system nitrogen regulation response regulator GlnG
VFTIHLPPLRDRLEDLPILVQHYLRRFSAELGREIREIAPEALARLRAYSWPGNIRELQSVLRQALLRASGAVLLPGFLPELSPPVRPSTHAIAEPAFDLERFIRQRLARATNDLSSETHREVDRLLMTLALEYTHGNHRDASRLLGISRQTMRVKLRALGLHVAHSVEPDDDDTP